MNVVGPSTFSHIRQKSREYFSLSGFCRSTEPDVCLVVFDVRPRQGVSSWWALGSLVRTFQVARLVLGCKELF
jgi:hypothetical protein